MAMWTGPPPLRPPTDGSVSGYTLNNMLRRWREWEEHTMTVPEGTAQDVLDWVGDDPARAQEALDAENAKPTPRTTLTNKLESIAAQSAAQEDSTVSTAETTDGESAEVELAPAPEAPAGEDIVVDLSDRATFIGPANVLNDDVAKPDDSYDLAAAEAQAEGEKAPVDAAGVEYFQVASNGGNVVLRFDGTAVLLDANQAVALSKDLKQALAAVTY